MHGMHTVLLIFGLLVVLVSAGADLLGLGGSPGFGNWQIAGTLGGLFISGAVVMAGQRRRGG